MTVVKTEIGDTFTINIITELMILLHSDLSTQLDTCTYHIILIMLND